MKKVHLYTISIAVSGAIALGGCSASRTLMENSTLKTETKMSSTVFLDPVAPEFKTVLVQIRNTTDKADFNPKNQIITNLTKSGYNITTDPRKAHYLLQANILKAGEAKSGEAAQALLGGYGAALEGAGVGALIAAYQDTSDAYLTGGLAGAAIGTVANSMIKNVTINVVTDLQISERSDAAITESNQSTLKQGTSGNKTVKSSEKTNWKRYQTRVVSTANKVNLAFEDAEPELTKGIAQSISGIFG